MTAKQRKQKFLKSIRKDKRAMFLFVDVDVYKAIQQKAYEQRPPIKPGPMAAEILRAYFEVTK